MKTKRSKVAIACMMIGVVYLGAGPLGAEGFRDDFINPEPTNPDREPVTWFPVDDGHRVTIEDGYLLVGSGTVGPNAGAAVDNFTPQDVSIEAQLNVLEGELGGLFLRGDRVTGVSYWAQIHTSDDPQWSAGAGGVLFGRANPDGSNRLLGSRNLNFTDDDVIMRFQAVGSELSVWVWPVGEERPLQPTLRNTDSAYSSGYVGVYANTILGTPTTLVEFDYFEAVVIPEPSTAMIGGLGFLSLVAWRRRERSAI